jgi:hypothetical protein
MQAPKLWRVGPQGLKWTAMEQAELLNAAPGKVLSPAAIRALEEAAQRHAAEAEAIKAAAELGGPAGLEPTRFGDWERKGLAVDF